MKKHLKIAGLNFSEKPKLGRCAEYYHEDHCANHYGEFMTEEECCGKRGGKAWGMDCKECSKWTKTSSNKIFVGQIFR